MILITGATGLTGFFLLEELTKKDPNCRIRCFVRENSTNLHRIKNFNIELAYGDMEDEESLKKALEGVDTVIHIVNIRYSPKVLRLSHDAGVKKIVFIHTTGMFSKYRDYAEEYRQIENEIIQNCKIKFIILRPTMIYGSNLDRNMHKLVNYVKNHRIFPIFGSGKCLMQPVHGRDLAKAIILSLNSTKTENKCYNISGGTVLKYREILSMIASKVNPEIVFVYIPFFISVFLGICYSALCKMLRKESQISVEQIRRLNENKAFSYDDASNDFGYSPISFEDGIDEEIRGFIC